jgi:hypothetical protein
MISVMDNDGVTEIFLATVDHVSDAASAAQVLWRSVHEATKLHGGTVHLLEGGDGMTRTEFGVQWRNGPRQWADAYVVSEGASVLGFSAYAAHDAVIFGDTN